MEWTNKLADEVVSNRFDHRGDLPQQLHTADVRRRRWVRTTTESDRTSKRRERLYWFGVNETARVER
jgi:hypothetical protein